MKKNADERCLIKRMKKDDYGAFKDLYQMYAVYLYRYCMQWTKCHEESEDIVQNAFIRLWQSRKRIECTDTIRYYIFTIVRNQIKTSYRRNLSCPVVREFLQYDKELSVSTQYSDDAVSFSDFLQLLETISQILPKTQQKVFKCSVLQQKRNQEIALELGLSEQTVKNQLSLALKVFRRKLSALSYIFLFLM